MWMALLGATTAAAGFGGADLQFVGEVDTVGSEVLVDARLRPLQMDAGAAEITWAPAEVSWGIAPATGRLDRLVAAGLYGERVFSSGATAANFTLGEIAYDQEDDTFDLTFAEGGIAVGLLDERLQLFMGSGVRLRYLDAPLGEDWALQLGVPLNAQYVHPLPYNLYATGEIGVRPLVGLAGDAPFTFDALGRLEGGLLAVDEEEIDVRVFANYVLRYDSWTTLDLSLEHRVNLGARVAF